MIMDALEPGRFGHFADVTSQARTAEQVNDASYLALSTWRSNVGPDSPFSRAGGFRVEADATTSTR